MRNKYSNQGSTLGRMLIAGSVLLALVPVTLGYQYMKKGWPFTERAAPAGPPEGTIAVPITAEAIPAYTRLTRDHFLNPRTHELTVLFLYPNQIGSGMVTNLNEILNRVLAVDKKAGYAVTERELLPKGTRAGLVAGIPAGKRAVVLEAAAIHGIHGLRQGDHLDLVASVGVEKKPAAGRDARTVLDTLRPHGALGTGKKRANVTMLAEDAVIVMPVTVRHQPPPPGARARGGQEPKGKPVEEVVIAVEPDEVTKISEAMGVDASITAVAHSGRPESSSSPVTKKPAPPSPPQPTAIEIIRGGKRTTMIFAPDGTPLDEVAGSPDIVPTPPPSGRP